MPRSIWKEFIQVMLEAITENEQLRSIQKNNPSFKETYQYSKILEIFQDLTRNNEVIEEYVPTVFGYLEIPSINLKQYVVSGTDEMSFTVWPGTLYLQTNLPGSGGNVGIAGHRTTYGAPFSRLDLLRSRRSLYSSTLVEINTIMR